MHKGFEQAQEMISHLKRYVNNKISQVKLTTAEKASEMISVFIAKIMVAILLLFFILFSSVAAAIAIGEYFGKSWLGFLFVASLYFIAGWVIWLGREKLIRLPIMNAIIARLFINETKADEKD